MAAFFAHFFIGVLGLIFPERFNLTILLISCQIPDFEYYLPILRGFFKKQGIDNIYRSSGTGWMHSITGSLFISIPIAVMLIHISSEVLGFGIGLPVIIASVMTGVLSHLITDIPAHHNLMLFWPFVKIDNNPFIFMKRRFAALDIFYRIGHPLDPGKSTQHVSGWNYVIFSHILLLLSYMFYLLYRG